MLLWAEVIRAPHLSCGADPGAAGLHGSVGGREWDSIVRGTWIVVAAYNEVKRLPAVLEALRSRYANVVVVDDGSVDGTAAAAERFPVWVLRHRCNLGQGAALQTGISFAIGHGADYVVTFDADGQHSVSDIQTLLAPLLTGQADFVLGSRFLGRADSIPWSRKLILKGAVLFTRISTGLPLTDTHNGLRAMTRRGAASLGISINGMGHASQMIEQMARSKLPVVEVPVTLRYSRESLDKGQRSTNAFNVLVELLLERLVR